MSETRQRTQRPNMGQQRQRAPAGGKGESKGAQQGYRRGPRPPKKSASRSCWWIFKGVLALAAALAAAVPIYRERYPTKQRCPPETDRFYDHCKEGRQHYLLSLDWDCLGSRRAEAMREVLTTLGSLPKDGKPLRGVGELPMWLTDENADYLDRSPCMKRVAPDRACRYCKPTPKPQRPDGGTQTADEQPSANAGGATTEGEDSAGGA